MKNLQSFCWCLGDQIGEDEEGEGIILGGARYPWEGTDRDYKYEEVCCFVLL